MSIIAKFYPNGEFSQGVDTSKTRRDNRNHRETLRPKLSLQCRHEYLQWVTENESISEQYAAAKEGSMWRSSLAHTYVLIYTSQTSCVLKWQDEAGATHYLNPGTVFPVIAYQFKLTPLVHQMRESCEKPPSRKKLEKMTGHMARNIRNGVYLLEQMFGGKDCMSFLTLTLPDLSSNALEDCCRNWDKMVKRFFDWLRTRLAKYNMELQHVYCTEIQPKRLQKRHEYAPHLHVVFRGRHGKKCNWLVTPKQVRKAWARCLSSVVSEHFSTSALENLQRVKHSAARYLGKYLGKGSRNLSEDTAKAIDTVLHTQWGGMSRTISRLIKRLTVRVADDGGDASRISRFISALPSLVDAQLVSYYKVGVINTAEAGVETFGFGIIVRCGALSTSTLDGGLRAVWEYVESLPSPES